MRQRLIGARVEIRLVLAFLERVHQLGNRRRLDAPVPIIGRKQHVGGACRARIRLLPRQLNEHRRAPPDCAVIGRPALCDLLPAHRVQQVNAARRCVPALVCVDVIEPAPFCAAGGACLYCFVAPLAQYFREQLQPVCAFSFLFFRVIHVREVAINRVDCPIRCCFVVEHGFTPAGSRRTALPQCQ
jgi:hypothetical protein